MNIFNIFPNPIFVENCPYQNSVRDFVEQKLKEENLDIDENCPNMFHLKNEISTPFLEYEEMGDFKQWLINCCNYYVVDVLGYNLSDGMTITDSWLNVCNKGGFQVPHLHTNSYVSGTYYVNMEDDHSPLNFRHKQTSNYSPTQNISLSSIPKKPTLYNSDASFFPKNGQLFLWQSHLTHGYFNNNKDNRISISMNFLPKKIINGRYGFEISPIICEK